MKQRFALVVFLLLGQVVHILATLRMAWALLVGSPQALKIALGYDALGNAAFNGHEREWISSRAGRARLVNRRWGCILCRFLDVAFSKNHCEKSILTEYLDPEELEVYKARFGDLQRPP